jgi:hypothetical protein
MLLLKKVSDHGELVRINKFNQFIFVSITL